MSLLWRTNQKSQFGKFAWTFPSVLWLRQRAGMYCISQKINKIKVWGRNDDPWTNLTHIGLIFHWNKPWVNDSFGLCSHKFVVFRITSQLIQFLFALVVFRPHRGRVCCLRPLQERHGMSESGQHVWGCPGVAILLPDPVRKAFKLLCQHSCLFLYDVCGMNQIWTCRLIICPDVARSKKGHQHEGRL